MTPEIDQNPHSEPHWRGALVAGLSGVFFALTALPGVHWHDTAEFAAVARRLSISHSPGHPIHAITTHGMQLLPAGDAAFRANLSSAVWMVIALTILYRALRKLAPAGRWYTAAMVALLPAVLPAIWLQGVRVEVYALQLAISATIGLLALHLRDARAFAGMALAFGLAGANHHLIGVALLPIALIGAWQHRRQLWLGLAGLVGLLVYAYLPLRAGAGDIGWGMPDSAAGLWHMVSAQEWVGANPLTQAAIDPIANAQKMTVWIIEQVGLLAATILLIALLYAALRRRTGAWIGCAIAFAGVLATKLLYPFDPLNPDLGGYLAPALCALLAMAWVGLAAADERWPIGAGLAGLMLLWIAPGFDAGHRQDSRVAEQWGRALLADVPPDGVLVASDYASHFLIWGLFALEGARPDAAVVFRGQMDVAWYRARLKRRRPGFTRIPIDARVEPGVRPEQLGPLRARLGPAGVALAHDAAASLANVRAGFGRIERSDSPDLDSMRSMGLVHVQYALHHLARAPAPVTQALVRFHLAEAEAWAGPDPMITRIGARLNALDPAAGR
ncbi:MAG: hypothetical protein ACI9U2_001296 [Bradymonadia bacterium]